MINDLANKSLEEIRFAVVDTETTGLSGTDDYVLQLGVVVARSDGTIEDQYETFVRRNFWKPGRLGAFKVHGITRRNLWRGISPNEMLERLNDYLSTTIFVAHNAKFDIAFLTSEATRANTSINLNGPLDTLKLSRALDPKRSLSHRLKDVTARYNVVVARPHDALADALGTALVLPHLLRAHNITTAEQLKTHFGA
ncbi:MAG: 3'-5' exonuclease [Actinobacteria bacterium]|jgi:DNA polymerase III alpha subunit (gram-positive type)|nr:MAG: 3'-5' exonuclease [Actinomycetota bacterium]